MYGAAVSTPAPPLRLGPFRLVERIASGGMGVIWRGVHVEQDVPVAVKVMVADELQSGAFRRAFRNEVWAMARLDHRGVVMVFDQGVIPPELEATSGGALTAGSPYIVMDYVEGGTLSDKPPNDWWDLKRILLLLLDALAHAHARGVTHRDLKPANILLDDDVEASGGLQLTDFGISHAAERALPAEEGAAPVMGTLHYMAPEQMDGRWRDFGPWTDLYSLGCIAWELACGRLPFDAEDPLDLMDQHLEEAPPPLEPLFDVPSGFEHWVLSLMEKEPYDRPSRAADVARDLKELGGVDEGDRTRALGLTMVEGLPAVQPEHLEEYLMSAIQESRRDRATPNLATLDEEFGLQTLTTMAPVGADADDDDDDDLGDDSSARAGVRLGLSWRRQRRPREWKRLAGVGLGLWGLRQTPLVGRDHEVDALWTALRTTHREHVARAIVLDGDLGVGTSRIALWLCERAHELGVADVMWANHSPQAGPSDGLSRMLSREFRCTGLSPAMRDDRVAELLERRGLARPEKLDAFAAELGRWMAPNRGSPVPSLSDPAAADAPRPRFKELYRLIRRIARRRPVVLWIDDAHWGLEAMAFAWYVLRAQETNPADVLLLLTMQGDRLEDDEEAMLLLHQIGRHRNTLRIGVPPLQQGDEESLLSGVLGLERGLAKQVAASSGGNPLFATQLMGDWVRSGVLEPGPWGFRLRPGEDVSIPSDLLALWNLRVEGALQGFGPEAFQALVLMAALGGRVDAGLFEQACEATGLDAPPGLVERLFAERLAVPSKGGWSFVHDGLRVAIARRARTAGTWREARRAVRDLRRPLPSTGATTTPTRVVTPGR
jgi:serine/threonine protein kinase